jgi:predicted MFS family arabinose efflux permease
MSFEHAIRTRSAERLRNGSQPSSSIGLQIAAMFMGSTLLTPLFPLYRREFGFSDVTLTLVYAAYVIGNLAALFFFGRLSDQIGRRRVSLPAIALGGIASLVFLFALATPWLFVARALSGLAIGAAAAAASAWAVELLRNRQRASALATTANMLGVAVGPLLAGLLAEFAPAPLRTTFVVHVLLLAVVAWQIARLPETVAEPLPRWRDASYRPLLGVPREVRSEFISPAACGFAIFALGGYYAALLPVWLADELAVPSPAISGAIVAAFYAIAAAAIILTRTLPSRAAMLGGLVLLVPSSSLLLLAQIKTSIVALLVATPLGAAAMALGYRGTLEVINSIAPDEQRAQVTASYMIACFLGNALPVIGVAVLSQVVGAPVAYAVFAAVIVALASIGLATGWSKRPRMGSRDGH